MSAWWLENLWTSEHDSHDMKWWGQQTHDGLLTRCHGHHEEEFHSPTSHLTWRGQAFPLLRKTWTSQQCWLGTLDHESCQECMRRFITQYLTWLTNTVWNIMKGNFTLKHMPWNELIIVTPMEIARNSLGDKDQTLFLIYPCLFIMMHHFKFLSRLIFFFFFVSIKQVLFLSTFFWVALERRGRIMQECDFVNK